jgi:hypothetical protein
MGVFCYMCTRESFRELSPRIRTAERDPSKLAWERGRVVKNFCDDKNLFLTDAPPLYYI